MLRPYDANAMRCDPVSARLSSVANDDAECAAPVEIAQEQARLERKDCGRMLPPV